MSFETLIFYNPCRDRSVIFTIFDLLFITVVISRMPSPDEDDSTLLNLHVPSVFQVDDENENEIESRSNGKLLAEDRTRSASPPGISRRQNSIPGGRSLGPSPTICQGSPFIYCGTQNNNHRRIVQHNSMRATYSTADRERRREQGHSGSSRNGSKRLKRHDTDPSIEKRHSGLLIFPNYTIFTMVSER